MNTEIVITCSLECGNVLGVLRVSLQRLRDTISFDELVDTHLTSMEFRDGLFEIPENCFRRSCFVEALKTLSLDVFDKRRRRPLSSLYSSNFELVFTSDLSEVLRQRASGTLPLWDKRDPIVVSLVFESDLDPVGDLTSKNIEALSLTILDVGIGSHPDRVDDPADDMPSTSFELLFRRQQNLASKRIDCLVAFDPPKLRVRESFVAETGDENLLQCT